MGFDCSEGNINQSCSLRTQIHSINGTMRSRDIAFYQSLIRNTKRSPNLNCLHHYPTLWLFLSASSSAKKFIRKINLMAIVLLFN